MSSPPVQSPPSPRLSRPTSSISIPEEPHIIEPHEWSSTRRWAILIVLSCISLTVNMALVVCAPASTAISEDLHNTDAFLSVFYITVPNLGQVLSPLYIGPLSERYGRVPVCHAFNAMFLLFTMASGFGNSLPVIIAFRFLAGACIASITLNPAITGDLFPQHKRGSAMAITSMIPIAGSAVGPIIGGYITQYLSWRWTFWIMAIINAAFALLLMVVLKESYLPILRRRAPPASGQQATMQPEKPSSKYLSGWNVATLKAVCMLIVRPFTILASSRIGVLMAVYLSVLFAYVSLLAATLATVFQSTYGFSESKSGLIYVSMTIGILVGAVYCRFTLDYFFLHGFHGRAVDRDAPPRPENRLISIIPGMATFPVGLLMYGWSLQQRVHWIVPTLATALCGFSLSSSTTPIMSYIVDIFGDRSASAVAAVLPLRYLFGAFMPIAAPAMYSKLGYGWANSLLAFVLIAIVPVPLITIAWPHRIRSLTKVEQ